MIGVYFSGTGNTRYCVERFVAIADKTARCFSIEDEGVINELSKHETVVFGFPVYYSNIPKIAKDFLANNSDIFTGKRIYIITTKAFFNAYAVGYANGLFKHYGAQVIGSLQLNMPENIRDLRITKIYTGEKLDSNIVRKADIKLTRAATMYAQGSYTRSGLRPINSVLGWFWKLLWFFPKTDNYISAPKVNTGKCTSCGICVGLCPTGNIKLADNKAITGDKCTVCYRCCNNCPSMALTILGSKVYGQYTLDGNLGSVKTARESSL